jgi:type IV pilus assembly protein PilC
MTAVFLTIIPNFAAILVELFGELPGLTKLFVKMSNNVVSFWVGAGVVVGVIIVLLTILSSSPAGRRFKESIILKLPVFGRLYHSSILGKMAEAMAMMVATGCDMPTCLRLSASASGSESMVRESETVAGQIEQGANVLEAGQYCRIIPRLFFYSVQLGTQRNELQDNLCNLGQMYAQQVQCYQSRLQTVLLPIMLILVGGFLLLAILSIFLPMIKVVSSLSV